MDRQLSRRKLLAQGALLLSAVAAVTVSAACGRATVSSPASTVHGKRGSEYVVQLRPVDGEPH